MISEIETAIVEAINESNRLLCLCLEEPDYIPPPSPRFRDITDWFEPGLRDSHPDLIVIASIEPETGLIDNARIGGINCKVLPDPQIASEQRLQHDNLVLRYNESDDWHSIRCEPYINGNIWQFHFHLRFRLECADCGRLIEEFSVYLDFTCPGERNIYTPKVVSILQDIALHAKDEVINSFPTIAAEATYNPKLYLDADTLTDTIGFPYKDVINSVASAIMHSVDNRLFQNIEITDPRTHSTIDILSFHRREERRQMHIIEYSGESSH